MISIRNVFTYSDVLWRCGGTLTTVRYLNVYHYKPKRVRDKLDRRTSLEWAKSILRNKQQEPDDANINKEPHMLHVVYLIKKTHGRPWWEKQIIEQLELEGKLYQPVIHKNVPSINRLLDEVKHLVHIQPLCFPHGLPEHESDFEHTLIRSNGEMVVKKRLKQYEPESAVNSKPTEDLTDKWKLQLDTVKKELEKRLQNFDVHTEFFRAKYTYRRNQDGQQYRYTVCKNTPKYDW